MNAKWLDTALWLRRWEQYWFPETTAVRLAVLRIVVVALQLGWFQYDLATHLDLVRSKDGFINPQPLIGLVTTVVPPEVLRTPEAFSGIWWATTTAGVLALIGLFTRPAALVFALGNWVLVAHQYSYGEIHHPEAIYCIFLLLLALAPSGRCLSLDSWLHRRASGPLANSSWGPAARFTTAMWPLTTVQWLLALAYLSAGLCKLVFGGPSWLNGYTLQAHLLQDAIRWDRPVGLWMAQQHELCLIASYFTVAFELGFFLVLLAPRTAPLFLVSGLMIHLGIFIMQKAPFWQFMVLYAAWVPFERLMPLAGEVGWLGPDRLSTAGGEVGSGK